jgi:integrase
VLFNSALNDDPPLIQFNPVTGIKFEEARIGKKKPVFFAETKQALEFLDAARELGGHYLLLASIGLMAGLRKSEMLALRWADINFENQTIRVANRVEQITLEVKQGTKAGRLETRIIPASPELFKVLTDFKSSTEFNLSDDFLFAKGPARRFINPREFSRMIEDINKKSGLKVTIHGLRHTFGREFAQRSGNIKALQAILGHSSSHTTDIYSELSDSRLDPFKGVVTYKNK